MSLIEAIILGIIQGLTEFLPVSSSGHLEIGSYLLKLETEENLLFSILLHAATALSTIIIFRKDIADLIKEGVSLKWNSEKEYILKIGISMMPVAIVGLYFEEYVTAFFGGNLILVGCMLLLTGLLLSFTYFTGKKKGDITYSKSLVIGIAQAIAVLPGISRSGSTIAVALLLGVEKSKAAKFSFLMVLVPILGASFLKIKDYVEASSGAQIDSITPTALAIGFISAFASGLVACNWMIGIVKKGKLIYFAYYCFSLGIIAILSSYF